MHKIVALGFFAIGAWAGMAGVTHGRTPPFGSQQTNVTIGTDRSVRIETEEAAELAATLITSSLRGVGAMIQEMRGVPAAGGGAATEASVTLDPTTSTYTLEVPGGGYVVVTEQGEVRIEADDAARFGGEVIRGSLAGVGKMIRALRTRGSHRAPIGLTRFQIQALRRSWQVSGLSQDAVEEYSEGLSELDRGMQELEVGMDELARAMARLEGRTEEPPAPSRGGALTDGLEPHGPVRCSGAQRIELRGRVIDAAGDALVVQGACRVELIDCVVRASERAIRVSGQGAVRLVRSTVEGERGALHMSGAAEIVVEDSELYGGVELAGGNPSLAERGRNVIR